MPFRIPSGKVIFHAPGSNVVITLPNACPAGFTLGFVNTGIGQITFAVESGGVLISYGGKNKLAAQYDSLSVTCYLTSGTGSAVQRVLRMR